MSDQESLEDVAAAEKYGHFLGDVLKPWCSIEGSEIGDTMENVRLAGLAAVNYLGLPGLKVMLALDESVREMLTSEWFVEMLEEEQPPYDYYHMGIREAEANFEKIKHDHLSSTKQFGGKYGGAEAERLINTYEPIKVLP